VGKEERRLSESLKNSERSSDQQGVLTEEKKEEMRLSESLMNSEKSSDQQGALIGEEEDQRCILIIGGISIFLPSNPNRGQCKCRRRKTTNRDYHGEGEGEYIKIFPRDEGRGAFR
jgi:hypothetical protein